MQEMALYLNLIFKISVGEDPQTPLSILYTRHLGLQCRTWIREVEAIIIKYK